MDPFGGEIRLQKRLLLQSQRPASSSSTRTEAASSTAALRRQQVVESIDLGIEHGQILLFVGAPCGDLPQRYRLVK
jgi:hypothetical protein